MAKRKQQRPQHTRELGDNLKLHLRLVTVGEHTYRLVTLRPGTQVAYSTNYFHGTWHIVSDKLGSQFLARLLWGLSYQRQPGTLILLHGVHLKPTPFEGEPSDPILLIPACLTSLDRGALDGLKRRLARLGPSNQTIRWQTFGLNLAQQEKTLYWQNEEHHVLKRPENKWQWQRETMRCRHGFLCYTAPSAVLRAQALAIYRLQTPREVDMDYHFLVESSAQSTCKYSWYPDGEVQIFADYRRRLAQAAQARRQVLARLDRPIEQESLREAIYQEVEAINRHRNLQKRSRS